MPPKPEASNGADSSENNEDEDEGPSLKDRIKTSFTNFKNSIPGYLESFRLFIYDKEHQTIFGNSSSSWMKLSIYYLLFYICLGLFYSGMVAVFAAIMSRESPTYYYFDSKMNINGQVNIGVSFRPMPSITDTSITVYNDTSSQNNTISTLRAYILLSLTQTDPTYIRACSPTEPASQLQGSTSCSFSWSDIVTSDSHPCSEKNMFGWSAGKPCILIKLNKVYGWVPQPGNMTAQIVNATNQPVLPVDQRESNIFITCDGQDAFDKDVLGSMVYYSLLHPLGYPNYGGIPYYFYPYTNSKEYVEPFVLVQFTSLPLFTLVNIECRAWAPNIQQLNEGTTRRGLATFNLYYSTQNSPNIN